MVTYHKCREFSLVNVNSDYYGWIVVEYLWDLVGRTHNNKTMYSYPFHENFNRLFTIIHV